jgi:hypothetical protein
MIKAKMQLKSGEPLYLLGLSGENVVRLMRGSPVHIKLKDIGGKEGEILIMVGETEETIMAELRKQGFLDADAAVKTDKPH